MIRDRTKDAIAVLEHVVGTDPNYAPAWEALGLRYYYDSRFGDGGEKMFQRSNSAYERALALDPNRELAASNLITNRVERGELGRAYDAATDLVRRHPRSANAHFALSYVLRYAGMLDQSTQECNSARQLDPGNFSFRLRSEARVKESSRVENFPKPIRTHYVIFKTGAFKQTWTVMKL